MADGLSQAEKLPNSGNSSVSFLCVVCVEKIGVGRAEWAAIYRGDRGYCPEHIDGSGEAT